MIGSVELAIILIILAVLLLLVTLPAGIALYLSWRNQQRVKLLEEQVKKLENDIDRRQDSRG